MTEQHSSAVTHRTKGDSTVYYDPLIDIYISALSGKEVDAVWSYFPTRGTEVKQALHYDKWINYWSALNFSIRSLAVGLIYSYLEQWPFALVCFRYVSWQFTYAYRTVATYTVIVRFLGYCGVKSKAESQQHLCFKAEHFPQPNQCLTPNSNEGCFFLSIPALFSTMSGPVMQRTTAHEEKMRKR